MHVRRAFARRSTNRHTTPGAMRCEVRIHPSLFLAGCATRDSTLALRRPLPVRQAAESRAPVPKIRRHVSNSKQDGRSSVPFDSRPASPNSCARRCHERLSLRTAHPVGWCAHQSPQPALLVAATQPWRPATRLRCWTRARTPPPWSRRPSPRWRRPSQAARTVRAPARRVGHAKWA